MRRSMLVVVFLVTAGIWYSSISYAHLSSESGHIGRWLWTDDTGTVKSDPVNLMFTWSDDSYIISHFTSAYHFSTWIKTQFSANLIHFNHSVPNGQGSTRANADCGDCARNHIRFYFGGVNDPNHGNFTVAAVHRDITCNGRHVGWSYNEKRNMVRDEYAYNNEHNWLIRDWANPRTVTSPCTGLTYQSDGIVTYIDGRGNH